MPGSRSQLASIEQERSAVEKALALLAEFRQASFQTEERIKQIRERLTSVEAIQSRLVAEAHGADERESRENPAGA